MRAYRCLLVCTLCSVARVAAAQLTSRDTAVLVDAVADRIRTVYGTGAAREPVVIVARHPPSAPEARFAMLVSAAVSVRDSSLITAAPTRSTLRILVGPPSLV